MKLRVCLLSLMALLTVGCTSVEDPFDREAAAVVERSANENASPAAATPADDEQPAAAVNAGTDTDGCVLETVEDEYGLPIEVEVCPSDDPETAVSPASSGRSDFLLDPWFGSAESRSLTTVITHRVLTPCVAELPQYPELPANVEAELAAVFAAIDAVQQQCSDGEKFRLASTALFAEVEAASVALLGRGPRSAIEARSDEQLVAQAIEHVEWLSWVLDGATGIVSHRPDLWFGSAIRGHIVASTELEGIDTLLLGNSQTQSGMNPAGLPVDAYNASVPGSEPSAYAEVYEYFGRGSSFDPDTVVLGLSAVDFVVSTPGGCSRNTGASLAAMFDLHATLYASSPLDLNQLTMERLLTRPSLRQSLARTPLAGDHNRRVSALGTALEYPALSAELRSTRFETRAAVFEAWVECPARFRDVTRLLNTAERRSDKVIVVLMPLDPEVIARAPEQAASISDLNERIAATVEEGGGTVLDLTTLLASTQMRDAVHPTEAGAMLVTASVAEVLAAG